MRIQVLFLLAVITLLAPASAARASCFHEAIPLKGEGDNTASGKTEEGVTWAQVRGTVDHPSREVLSALLDHNTTKSSRVSELEVEHVAKPGLLDFHRVHFLIKPFLFVKIRWTEEWSYKLVAGTAEKPAQVAIEYEKVDGTDYIPHLCGGMVLRRVGDTVTDVYLYEEAKATQRSVEDTLKGLLGTLETLRKRKE